MNTESEINAHFFPIINALADKHDAASLTSRAVYEAYLRTYEGRRSIKTGEAWAAYEIARDARKAAEAELNDAFDARAEAKKKLKAANRKAWFNS